MHTRVLLAVVLALIVPVGTATAGGALPKYIVDDGIAFGVYANAGWHAFSPASTELVQKAPVDRGPAPSKDPSFMVWTKTCSPGQVVTFERTVEFLGRPLTLGGFTQTGLDVKSWDIYFNGARVAHLLKRVQPIFDLADRKLLKAGDNVIRFEVALSKAARACTDDSRPGRRGVWFSLTGTNATDITVNQPAPKNAYHQGRAYLQQISVANRGRALATEAVLTIKMASHVACLELNPDNTCKDWMFQVDTPVSDLRCRPLLGDDPSDERVLQCRIKNLTPRDVLTVNVRMEFHLKPGAPDWVTQQNALSWEVTTLPGAVGDFDLANNKGEVHVTYCQYGVGSGRCKASP